VEDVKMARILLLGATGMAGHITRIHLLEKGHEVISVARTGSSEWIACDLEDEVKLIFLLNSTRPNVVINCVGVLIKGSEEDPLRAIRLNALLPRILERKGAEMGYRLLQKSTDCVFSGANGPYREMDRRDSDEIYGRTKALGEVNNERDLTIRTSIIGPELTKEGSGLFNWFFNQHGAITGYAKVMWGGVTSLELAKAMDFYIRNPIAGLVHLTNGTAISKLDLLTMVGEIWRKKDVIFKSDCVKVSNRGLLTTRKDFIYEVPPYLVMLEELHDFYIRHSELYGHYA
jgi:dTDP-4-dehydrorhamnose reductase